MPNKTEPNSNATAPDKALALRFISGKYQGGEYPLENGKEIIVGRSSDLDMVLVEEMVSRRHARIVMRGGLISIQDLGSTNGTFVNGEKIRHAKLREGDRVLIGTSILKVVAVSQRQPQGTSLESVAKRRVTQRQQQAVAGEEAPRMTGNLQEIPLPDLMQLFGTSRKTGVLALRASNQVGRIWLEQGLIRHAEIDSAPDVAPLKTMYRLLGWSEGLFELNPPDKRTFDEPLDASVQEILMEGFRQQDELKQLLERLPARSQRLILRTPLEAPLHELEPDHLDVLQQALNSASLQALMDRTKQTDLETAQIVRALIDRGYLTSAN